MKWRMTLDDNNVVEDNNEATEPCEHNLNEDDESVWLLDMYPRGAPNPWEGAHQLHSVAQDKPFRGDNDVKTEQ